MSTQEYIGDLANAVRTCPDEEFLLEALGILGNLTVEDVNFQQLLTDYDMLNYIKTKLQPGDKVPSCFSTLVIEFWWCLLVTRWMLSWIARSMQSAGSIFWF